ncbi:MAG: hypothetical protein N2246_06775 [Candidatus Sumerlaeia bacterium]|nr:hypothetical protein [Candidatus Sumerlaeia bacterium]
MKASQSSQTTEKRLGELLIELGFITPEQLQQAMELARQRKLRVGEALFEMGALKRDSIYWVLGTQLNMNYVELYPEMIPEELIQQFSLDVLEKLQCLPLHEDNREIHFAIADPTNAEVVNQVKSLRLNKEVQLHLALPEKIQDILKYFRRKLYHSPPSLELKSQPQQTQAITPADSSLITFWNDFIETLLIMRPAEIYWLYHTSEQSSLVRQQEQKFEIIRQYNPEIYDFILKQIFEYSKFGCTNSAVNSTQAYLFLHSAISKQRGLFRLRFWDSFDKQLTQIERLPTFSYSDFIRLYPHAQEVTDKLQKLLTETSQLLIGGTDKLLIKQYIYLLVVKNIPAGNFLPPIFYERTINMYFPDVMQLIFIANSGVQVPENTPLLFFETELPGLSTIGDMVQQISSAKVKQIIIFCSASQKEFQDALSKESKSPIAGMKRIFIDNSQVTIMGDE